MSKTSLNKITGGSLCVASEPQITPHSERTAVIYKNQKSQNACNNFAVGDFRETILTFFKLVQHRIRVNYLIPSACSNYRGMQ